MTILTEGQGIRCHADNCHHWFRYVPGRRFPLLCIDHAEHAETLVTHPNGKCYGHLEWTTKGTTLVMDHCECDYNGNHPTVGCALCGATDIPVIGHCCNA